MWLVCSTHDRLSDEFLDGWWLVKLLFFLQAVWSFDEKDCFRDFLRERVEWALTIGGPGERVARAGGLGFRV